MRSAISSASASRSSGRSPSPRREPSEHRQCHEPGDAHRCVVDDRGGEFLRVVPLPEVEQTTRQPGLGVHTVQVALAGERHCRPQLGDGKVVPCRSRRRPTRAGRTRAVRSRRRRSRCASSIPERTSAIPVSCPRISRATPAWTSRSRALVVAAELDAPAAGRARPTPLRHRVRGASIRRPHIRTYANASSGVGPCGSSNAIACSRLATASSWRPDATSGRIASTQRPPLVQRLVEVAPQRGRPRERVHRRREVAGGRGRRAVPVEQPRALATEAAARRVPQPRRGERSRSVRSDGRRAVGRRGGVPQHRTPRRRTARRGAPTRPTSAPALESSDRSAAACSARRRAGGRESRTASRASSCRNPKPSPSATSRPLRTHSSTASASEPARAASRSNPMRRRMHRARGDTTLGRERGPGDPRRHCVGDRVGDPAAAGQGLGDVERVAAGDRVQPVGVDGASADQRAHRRERQRSQTDPVGHRHGEGAERGAAWGRRTASRRGR